MDSYVTLDLGTCSSSLAGHWSSAVGAVELTLGNLGACADVALEEQSPGVREVFESWTVEQWRSIVMETLDNAKKETV